VSGRCPDDNGGPYNNLALRHLMSDAIRAYSVDHEHWHISTLACSCGGRLAVAGQQLTEQGETPLDVITTACRACGAQDEVTFDISPFFGQSERDEQLRAALACVPERERKRILGTPLPASEDRSGAAKGMIRRAALE
jgi:hypothetical protein